MLKPLRHRYFRLLFAGQVVSNLGDWLDYLALIVLIAYTWHRGPGSLAALAIAIALPWAVLAPFLGVFADRWPRKLVLVGSDLARAAIVAGLIFAPSIYVLLVLVFLATAFSTLFSPAEQATIRATVPEDDLVAANSLSQLATQAAKVVGPALGGLIGGLSGPRTAFGVDSVTFVISAAILSRLPALPGESEHEEEPEPFWTQLSAGYSYILSRPALLLTIASMSATVFLVFTFDTLSPLALRSLGLGSSLLGLAIAGIGLGAVVGAIAIGSFGQKVNPLGLLGLGKAIAGALVALIGIAAVLHLNAAPAVWIPVVLGIGVASAGVLVSFPTILQLETPPPLMGRVAATASSLPTVLQLVAPILGAAIATAVGVGWVLLVAGAALSALGVTVALSRMPLGVGVPAPASGPTLEEEIEQIGFPVRTSEATAHIPSGFDPTTGREEVINTMADATSQLESAGFPMSKIPEEQQRVLAGLSDEEVRVLTSIKSRLDEAGPDTEAHMSSDRGNIFW